jgi:hypothetical protein
MGILRGELGYSVAPGVLVVGGLVIGVPAAELLGAGLIGGLPLPGFGKGALGAGEVVGGFVG